jgi:hypothetical protein
MHLLQLPCQALGIGNKEDAEVTHEDCDIESESESEL